MTYVYIAMAVTGVLWLASLLSDVAAIARNVGHIADELRASREEQKRQFELERQYPTKQLTLARARVATKEP